MSDVAVVSANGVGLSQSERVIDTFVAPSKTFEDIKRSSSWWLPFLLMAVFGYAFTFAVQKKVGFPTLVENTIRFNPKTAEKFSSLPPEQAAQQKKFMEYGFKGTFYAYPLFMLAFFAFCAVILWATMNFGFGGTAKYGEVLAVFVYAWLPAVLKTLLILVMLFVGDAENFNLSNPVGTNPGFYLGQDSAPWLKGLLESFDLFTLWSVVLLGIGVAIVARLKRNSGLIAVFTWFLLIVLVKTAYAAFTA